MSNSELLQKAKRKILSEIAMTKINPNINLNASASTGPRSPSGDSNPGADFIRWVEEQGIEINGIEIDYLADKLTGFVATQALKVQESESISVKIVVDCSAARRNPSPCSVQSAH